MGIHFEGELLHHVLGGVLSRCSLRGSLQCRATRWGVALWCESAEQQACPLQMLRIAVSGLASRKSEFPEVYSD
jgi:hypothetical protein